MTVEGMSSPRSRRSVFPLASVVGLEDPEELSERCGLPEVTTLSFVGPARYGHCPVSSIVNPLGLFRFNKKI